MLVDLACAWLSAFLLCCSVVTRPAEARCVASAYVNGVRPTGVYECRRTPGGDPLYDGAAGYPDRTVDRPGWYRGRVWCGRRRPIVVLAERDADARAVGCR